jgi:hypothetical protein
MSTTFWGVVPCSLLELFLLEQHVYAHNIVMTDFFLRKEWVLWLVVIKNVRKQTSPERLCANFNLATLHNLKNCIYYSITYSYWNMRVV